MEYNVSFISLLNTRPSDSNTDFGHFAKLWTLAANAATGIISKKNNEESASYIIDKNENHKARYQVHSFDSEAVMVDIWIEDMFYVIQIDGNVIGFSLITQETTPFDIIPDHSFKDSNEFKISFESIFHKNQ